MRLFVGLSIPSTIARQLACAVEQVKTHVAAPTWVPPQNWHITLLFLGEVAPHTATALHQRLAAVAQRTPSFALWLEGWGAFPNLKRAKLLWAGVEGERDRLQRLAASVHETVAELIPLEKGKSFVPHITLTRKVSEQNITRLNDQLPFRTKTWPVQEIHLYVSHLSPGGARYEIVASYPLATPPSDASTNAAS